MKKPTTLLYLLLCTLCVSATTTTITVADYAVTSFITTDNRFSIAANKAETSMALLYSINFTNSQVGWTIDNKVLPASGAITYVWREDANYGYQASAYVDGTNYVTESWLISPFIDFEASSAEHARLSFSHARRFGSLSQLSVKITKDGSSWETLNVPNWPDGSNWTFIESGDIDITDYISDKTQVAFVYTSDANNAATWEIKTVEIYAGQTQEQEPEEYREGDVWQVAQELWETGYVVASAGYYQQIGSFDNLTAYVGDGAADWVKRDYTGSFTGVDGVTYGLDYIQGGTNGMKGHLMNGSGICSHLKLCPTADGRVYIAARYGMNKPIWAAKVPNSIVNSEALDYADLTPYLIRGFSEATATDSGIVMTKAMYISEDGLGLQQAAGSSDSKAAVVPLYVEEGYTYFFWLSGSKIMLCGLHTEWAVMPSLTYTITSTNPNTAAVSGYTGRLTNIDIPEEVTIGNATYTVTGIGNSAFLGCSTLTSVTLPNSIISIDDYAFAACTNLSDISFPNTLTHLGEGAFYQCSGLTSVTIPESVATMGIGTFWECSNLTTVVWNARNCASDNWLDIQESITYINPPFVENPIASLTFGEQVETIPTALCWGTQISAIVIPNSVTNIEEWAFTACPEIASIVVEEGNTVYDSRDECNAIIETATNTLIAGCQNTIIPNSITTIGDEAFRGCGRLTSITIPASVTRVGDAAFYECEQLVKIRCLAILPPRIYYGGNLVPNGANIVDDYDKVVLYVPCESLATYYTHANWGQFLYIRCLEDEIPDAIENTRMSEEQSHGAEKRLQNGQIVIINQGKTYNILGSELK